MQLALEISAYTILLIMREQEAVNCVMARHFLSVVSICSTHFLLLALNVLLRVEKCATKPRGTIHGENIVSFAAIRF